MSPLPLARVQEFLQSAPPPVHERPEKSNTPCFLLLSQDDDLAAILAQPYHFFVEIGTRHNVDETLTDLFAMQADFSLCLTTASAYRKDVARAVARRLDESFGLHGQKSMEIETCLQEAIANAVIHGNLAIHSDFKTIQGFEQHYSAIAERLSSEPFCNRRITIAAWNEGTRLKVAIKDEGQGFSLPLTMPQENAPHSRGLVFIHSLASLVWVGPDRRSLYMTFTHGEKQDA